MRRITFLRTRNRAGWWHASQSTYLSTSGREPEPARPTGAVLGLKPKMPTAHSSCPIGPARATFSVLEGDGAAVRVAGVPAGSAMSRRGHSSQRSVGRTAPQLKWKPAGSSVVRGGALRHSHRGTRRMAGRTGRGYEQETGHFFFCYVRLELAV